MSQIAGTDTPTDYTVGSVGDIYTNTNTGAKYKCVAIREIKSDEVIRYYTWVRIVATSSSSSEDKRYIDETTGVAYELKVNNGKLTMEEV